jgi:precorrin-6B methylase 2
MTPTSVVTLLQARPQPDTQENDLLDPLWRLAGDLRDAHALIVAEHGLDLMCGLLRRGCLAATVLRLGDKPDADDYDVVFVPLVTSADTVIKLARRSLVPNGRLIAGVSDAKAAVALARHLRLNGFFALRSTHLPNRVLLRADLRRVS